jgi:hypothetical protein
MIKKKETNRLVTEDLEEIEKKANIIPWVPKLITGGKGGNGHNWLSDLEEGTVFLVRPKASGGFALGQFHLLHKFDNAVHLMDNLTGGGVGETHIWVDPVSFCSQFTLVRVLYEPENDSTDD